MAIRLSTIAIIVGAAILLLTSDHPIILSEGRLLPGHGSQVVGKEKEEQWVHVQPKASTRKEDSNFWEEYATMLDYAKHGPDPGGRIHRGHYN